MTLKKKLYRIVFHSDTKAGKQFDLILLWAIILSVVTVILESSPSVGQNHKALFRGIEWFFSILFTIEYFGRILISDKPLKYIFSYWGLIDFLASIPTFLGFFITGVQLLVVLRIVRLLRIFRILKMVRFTKEAKILSDALNASMRKISIFLFAVVVLVLILGTLMYVVEGQQEGFNSILQSVYWAVVTITTVGYGDLVPQTGMGKLISSFIMIIGYAIIAVPTGIVTVEMSKKRTEEIECAKCSTKNPDSSRFCSSCGNGLTTGNAARLELSSEFVPQVKALLNKAASAIMEVYNSGDFSTVEKGDHSPLTRADTISNNIIIAGLKTITPEIAVISEETSHLPYDERKLFKEVWILDPIDGTKEFVSRNDEFCICLALIRNTRPVAGFILAPVTGEFWYAIDGEGAYCEKNNTKCRLPIQNATDKIKITRSRSHHNDMEGAWIRKIEESHQAETIIQGSAIKFCRLAEGTASVYPKFGSINEWDVAAGDIILTEAGGTIIETVSGNIPEYNKPDLKLPFFFAYARGVKGKLL